MLFVFLRSSSRRSSSDHLVMKFLKCAMDQMVVDLNLIDLLNRPTSGLSLRRFLAFYRLLNRPVGIVVALAVLVVCIHLKTSLYCLFRRMLTLGYCLLA